MTGLLDMLAGGDRRSVGRVAEVVEAVLRDRGRVDEILPGQTHDDPVVRMRAADVLEKVSRAHPDWLQPYAVALMEVARAAAQQEVQWHFAQMAGRLTWTDAEVDSLVRLFEGWFEGSDSRIVRTCALEALADMAERRPGLAAHVRSLTEEAAAGGVPSVAARARKLLRRRALAAVRR